jgi:MGT family glycosyltransferase
LEPFYMPVYHRVLHIARREGIAIRWGDYGYRLADTELVLGPKAIDLPGHRRRHARVYVGACVDTERAEDAFDWNRVKPDKPLVYCTVGSHGSHWNAENRFRLLKSVVEAFRAHPEYQVLLQTAREDECRPLEPLPDNVFVAPWYPQLEVLARASVLITHGGFGTVREALFFGIPMIVFPCGVDQPGNAARIARLQAGVRGDIRRVTAATISSMLRAVELPPYRQNALRLSGALRADNTCSEAVAVIEGCLDGTLKNASQRSGRGLTNCWSSAGRRNSL